MSEFLEFSFRKCNEIINFGFLVFLKPFRANSLTFMRFPVGIIIFMRFRKLFYAEVEVMCLFGCGIRRRVVFKIFPYTNSQERRRSDLDPFIGSNIRERLGYFRLQRDTALHRDAQYNSFHFKQKF